MIIRVLKAHIAKYNLTFRLDQLLRVRLIKNLYISIHNLQEPLNASDSALKLLCKLNNPADCRNQRRHIHDIRHHIPRQNPAFHQEKSAPDNNCQIHQSIKHSGGSAKYPHQHIGMLFYLQKILIALLEFLRLKRLIGKCLDNLLP